MDKIKKIIMYILIFIPVAKGASVSRATEWVTKVYDNLKNNKKYSLKKKFWAYRHGYMPEYVSKYRISADNIKNFISERDYYYLEPINGIYGKWINDMVSIRKVFEPFKEHLQELYYEILINEDNISVIPLDDCPNAERDIKAVFDLVRKKKVLLLNDVNKDYYICFRYSDSEYYLNDKIIRGNDDLIRGIRKFSKNVIAFEKVNSSENLKSEFKKSGIVLRMLVCNDGDAAKINKALLCECDENGVPYAEFFKGFVAEVDISTGNYYNESKCEYKKIERWENIKDTICKISRHAPQLEFFGADILITEDSFKFVGFTNTPAYPEEQMFDIKTVDFLKEKLSEKKKLYSDIGMAVKRGFSSTKRRLRKWFALLFFPKGLVPYLSLRWIKEVCIDMLTNREVGIKTKLWAYRRGFLSYRIPQYGITKENHKDYISDFEYKWLRHINGLHRVWLEDKITFKYIAGQFKEYFPKYYYYINTRDGVNKIVPMMDCPDGYGRKVEDIFRLAKEKKCLALKPDEGSHGDGFYKMSYSDGEFYLNSVRTDKKDILNILKNPDNQYLITEYINNHPQFKKIYDGAVNTIRLIVFKRNGKTAEIGNAYMRFGSTATGAVDNMGAGGMFVQVESETGWYGNAKIITHNSIRECPYHPDTGVLIEGYIPHWEKIKDIVIKIADSIQQLEYFGFDLAVTEDGVKFPEINRFPDYPKIEKLSANTIDYLLQKLEEKKHIYGYDKKSCKKLVHLPKR